MTTNFRVTPVKARVIGPIGKCIYGQDHGTSNLSREHVLPFGLGGSMILRKASCENCRETIHPFETECLTKNFGLIRAQRGMPTYNKKERVTHAKLLVDPDGERAEKTVPLDEYPEILFMPEFHAFPGIITGDDSPIPVSHRASYNEQEVRRRARLHSRNKDVVVEKLFNFPAFIRTLAKIAHGMMFMTYDVADIQPLLLNIILRGDLENYWCKIGGSPPIGSPDVVASVHEHRIRTQIVTQPMGEMWVMVSIHLFPHLNAPAYTLIAGRASQHPPQIPTKLPHPRRLSKPA
jgi:hypothetical protein